MERIPRPPCPEGRKSSLRILSRPRQPAHYFCHKNKDWEGQRPVQASVRSRHNTSHSSNACKIHLNPTEDAADHLWVPRATSSDALLMIAGEKPFCEQRMVYSEMNRERLRKHPERTLPFLLANCPQFVEHSATNALFQESHQAIRKPRRQCHIEPSTLNKHYAKFRTNSDPKHATALKSLLKRMLTENAHCNAVRALMNSSDSCTVMPHCYSRPKHFPLLRATGYQYSHYVQWLTNSIRIRDEFVLRNKKTCPLCSIDFQTDARQHLLTECKETHDLRAQFLETLVSIDQSGKAMNFYP